MGKSQKKGFLLPPAVGYSFGVLVYLFGRYRISFRYLIRTILTLLINVINWPFRLYEKVFINPKYKKKGLKEAPIFILGHWRSGTTHLHNILCQDPKMAYTTTYQSVFPDTLFNIVGKFIFKGFAKILIPGTRKGDNVTLGMNLPQEEEFAIGDKTPICFYYYWMFPRSLKKFYDQFIRFEGMEESKIKSWEEDYKLLITKALKNTKGERFLSKNPPNTGRVKKLLTMFPDARFIHIHRNPVEVYLSTHNFFHKMLPHLQLQSIADKDLEALIFGLYQDIMKDYLAQKELIPKNRLIEIAFEELESSPKSCIEGIYKKLELSGYQECEPLITSYLNKMKSYEKNKHYITDELLQKIKSQWGFAMKEWSYDVPEHIEIKK